MCLETDQYNNDRATYIKYAYNMKTWTFIEQFIKIILNFLILFQI